MEEITLSEETGRELPTEVQEELQANANLQLWEGCHGKITNAIIAYLCEYGTMPSQSYIAEATGLSRKTVHKHMDTFSASTARKSMTNSFGMMKDVVLAQILKAAIHGDLKAAKLYMEASKTLSGQEDKPQKGAKQNNYLQINNTIINQQIIQQLKPEQLHRIEEIIAKELHERPE
jgi:hypothetical protein